MNTTTFNTEAQNINQEFGQDPAQYPVLSQDQALCHLFFHCCLRDDRFSDSEMNDLSAKLVTLGLQPKLHIKDELISYRAYKPGITDEKAYLQYLLQLINPVNDLALYSYCVELCISEPQLDPREEALLIRIGTLLDIDDDDQNTINRLIAQRKAVEIQKIF